MVSVDGWFVNKRGEEIDQQWQLYDFENTLRVILWDNTGNTIGAIRDGTSVANAGDKYIAFTTDGVADGETILYRDGTVNGTPASLTSDMHLGPRDVIIGTTAWDLGLYPIDGKMDEIRMSYTVRSAAWIKATYNSLWGTLLTYGSEEIGGDEALEDMKTDIKAYQDFTQDAKADFQIAGWARKDKKLDLSAYFETIKDKKLDLETIQDLVEDIKTDLKAYFESFKDKKLDLHAFQDFTQNAIFDAIVAGWARKDKKLDLHAFQDFYQDSKTDVLVWQDFVEDMGANLDISGYFQILEDSKTDILVWLDYVEDTIFDAIVAGWARKDKKLDIFLALRIFEDLKTNFYVAMEKNYNAVLDIQITDGDSSEDSQLDLQITDGIDLHDVGLDLAVVGVMPAFRAVYAMHLDSVIKEVIK
ncbi:MAG: hypothetical protein JRC90_12110 [Deltaproteobacteria bacterium]|nr:hypothetical protein [Deltaproteobacteria bacterium]